MNIVDHLNSYRRVQALADVARRHSATIKNLTAAVDEVVDELPPDAATRLRAALRDAEAQVAATDDALSRAVEDLPEGQT